MNQMPYGMDWKARLAITIALALIVVGLLGLVVNLFVGSKGHNQTLHNRLLQKRIGQPIPVCMWATDDGQTVMGACPTTEYDDSDNTHCFDENGHEIVCQVTLPKEKP